MSGFLSDAGIVRTDAQRIKHAKEGSRRLLLAWNRLLLGEPAPAPSPQLPAKPRPQRPRHRKPIPEFRVIAHIKGKVAEACDVPMIDMDSRRRCAAPARQMAMYLTRYHTKASLPMIGRHFGNLDHTTVIHAIRAVEARRAKSPEYDQQIRELEAAL